MRKKVISMLMLAAMTATLFAGCGKKKSSEGKVLNIYCWNEEFRNRVAAHYPGYETVDGRTGKIGDVTVKWNVTPSEELAYQNNLDATLKNQSTAAADDKIDIFLVEADYALKYVNTDYTMPVSELGITDADIKDQYQYTKDIVTDKDGKLKGLSWQACPGVCFFNRDIAKDVFGTDDADEVQKHIKDWDTFYATADVLKEKGYMIASSVVDTYRVYSNNVTSKWVDANDKINIDANILKWVDESKKLVDKGEIGTATLWSDDWKVGFFPEGKVFCYFGPAWLINFCMAKETEGSVANLGKFNATVGPQSFYWGGTWICGCTGTDNKELVKDIMKSLCCDADNMMNIVKDDDDFVNHKPTMDTMASDKTYSSSVLGGINPLSIYCEGVQKIELKYNTFYDQACNEGFQEAIKNYFDGASTKEAAIDLFYNKVTTKHPELKR